MDKTKILIVEDEPGLLELLAINLQGSGYQTVTAVDGVEAWERFEKEEPDLITLDLNIPKISGFRLLEIFKRARPDVPIIAITAYSFEEVEEIARKGIDDFITKPVDFGLLAGKVERALARRDGD